MSELPLRIAVIGSGPSGFYAAEALLKQPRKTLVDVFDRFPTPYGLVRAGVAPDHQTIKAVVKVYDKTANLPGFRFFGNVTVGKDLTVDDLLEHYDAVVWAVGADGDKKMGIPGEDLAGSHSAIAFIGWYNGHPDHVHETFDLSCERVAIVGMGNVAMDVARMLLSDPGKLANTDICDHAVEALRASRVREVVVIGRRGLAQAAFTLPEIREIGSLADVDLCADVEECAVDALSAAELDDDNTKKIVAYVTERVRTGPQGKPKRVTLRFLASPVALEGEGRVQRLTLEKNHLIASSTGVSAQGTGVHETLDVGLVFRSVGLRGRPVPGVPFDVKTGTFPHTAGRVTDRQYVVGWAKRGPSGLIGTNRADSVATVNTLVADLAALQPGQRPDISARLAANGVQATSYADWKVLDLTEQGRGKAVDKLREKFVRVEDMLDDLT